MAVDFTDTFFPIQIFIYDIYCLRYINSITTRYLHVFPNNTFHKLHYFNELRKLKSHNYYTIYNVYINRILHF